jgi:beta-xylosidase
MRGARPVLTVTGVLATVAATVAATLLAGCGGGPAPTTHPTSATTGGTVTDRMTDAVTNPVWPSNFPDPQILPDGDGWVAIATNGNGMNVQTLVSDDLVTWTQGADALPQLPAWTTKGKVWAPEAHRFGDRWVLYYTTMAPDPAIQCIGLAVADDPKGPYRDTRSGPLVCEKDEGGSIDASPFVAADGTAYLYWKNDGNAVGIDTWISVQRLSSDGTRLEGEPKRLVRQDLPWEGNLVEAPFVWERDGVFHLFYSANDYGSDKYAVGHATASSPTGPFTKDPEPVLTSTDVAAGPGHCALLEKDGRVLMVYHAWDPAAIGSDVPGRTMWLSEVTFDGRAVSVTPPRTTLPARL